MAPDKRSRERGQALVIVAFSIIPMILLLGLAVDLGMLFIAKTKLQRAVDSAALSSAESMYSGNADLTEKAKQFLAANTIGSPLPTATVTFPPPDRVMVSATQQVPTLFMSILPAYATVPVTAEATAVLDTYAEVPIKPRGTFGKEGAMNPSVFGPSAKYSYGDAYSTTYLDSGAENADHDKMQYGYLFRIDVPSTYTSSQLKVEIFDPDCYNAPVEAHYLYDAWGHQYVNPDWNQDSTHNRANAYIWINGIDNGWHKYFRVDEARSSSGSQSYSSSYLTTTKYSLWHFRTDLVNLNPFADPSSVGTKIAEASYGEDSSTDLKWVSPSGFTVNLSSWDRETRDNSWSFYLYVESTAGSSENGFDIRTGPPGQSEEDDVNDQKNHSWESGGSMVFSRRAYPMNNSEGVEAMVYLTQVPETAAGMTLLVRHFDNDDDNTSIPYYLETAAGTDWNVATGKLSGSGSWYSSSTGSPDVVHIPARGTAGYNAIFGGGAQSTWLKAEYPSTIEQDSSVWELLYIRPRLLQ